MAVVRAEKDDEGNGVKGVVVVVVGLADKDGWVAETQGHWMKV